MYRSLRAKRAADITEYQGRVECYQGIGALNARMANATLTSYRAPASAGNGHSRTRMFSPMSPFSRDIHSRLVWIDERRADSPGKLCRGERDRYRDPFRPAASSWMRLGQSAVRIIVLRSTINPIDLRVSPRGFPDPVLAAIIGAGSPPIDRESTPT